MRTIGDWIAFLNYLVAAGREHDPGFAPTTASMLQDMSVGGPTRDAVIDVFLRELPSIAEHGAVLVLDDYHLVDESPDVRLIARELVARGPERLTIVFASRRQPAIPLARLRASGEVAELGTDDLAVRSRRDAAALQRDLWPGPRSGRARRRGREDRGLGRFAPARAGRLARSIAGRDPPLRPWAQRRRPGALRLPCRGGRRRSSRGSPAVPDANVDPPGGHARARGHRRPASTPSASRS